MQDNEGDSHIYNEIIKTVEGNSKQFPRRKFQLIFWLEAWTSLTSMELRQYSACSTD